MKKIDASRCKQLTNQVSTLAANTAITVGQFAHFPLEHVHNWLDKTSLKAPHKGLFHRTQLLRRVTLQLLVSTHTVTLLDESNVTTQKFMHWPTGRVNPSFRRITHQFNTEALFSSIESIA